MGKKASLAKLATAMRDHKAKNKTSMTMAEAIKVLGPNDPLLKMTKRDGSPKTSPTDTTKVLSVEQVLTQSLNQLISANDDKRPGADGNVRKVAELIKGAFGIEPGRRGETFTFNAADLDANAF